MVKGIVSVFLVFLLQGCGSGSSNGTGGESDDRDNNTIDPYLGVWEKTCRLVDSETYAYWQLIFITAGPNSDQLRAIFTIYQINDALYRIETLSITDNSIEGVNKYFSDSQCETPHEFVDDLMETISLANVGGEFIHRNEWVSLNGWPYVEYVVLENPFIQGAIRNLHNVDDFLYVVKEQPDGEFVVDFNDYYER
ncbi:hypothetical protein A9Q81_01365 [Gammaproteobacteria bacterium 42_54_T18]|nr:hypothetical protein A9Q81_01365 [Gammaproteobacteria bacterium 42_54_T18]